MPLERSSLSKYLAIIQFAASPFVSTVLSSYLAPKTLGFFSFGCTDYWNVYFLFSVYIIIRFVDQLFCSNIWLLLTLSVHQYLQFVSCARNFNNFSHLQNFVCLLSLPKKIGCGIVLLFSSLYIMMFITCQCWLQRLIYISSFLARKFNQFASMIVKLNPSGILFYYLHAAFDDSLRHSGIVGVFFSLTFTLPCWQLLSITTSGWAFFQTLPKLFQKGLSGWWH